jgi:hypothetical protein
MMLYQVLKLFGVWGIDVYREEGMLSLGRKFGESSLVMAVTRGLR